jgi:hypothetical protein
VFKLQSATVANHPLNKKKKKVANEFVCGAMLIHMMEGCNLIVLRKNETFVLAFIFIEYSSVEGHNLWMKLLWDNIYYVDMFQQGLGDQG